MKTLPIRIRLTLWYFAMFATAACFLSATSWWMLRRSVEATEYHDLQERAEDVQSFLLHQEPDQSDAALRQKLASIYSIKDDATVRVEKMPSVFLERGIDFSGKEVDAQGRRRLSAQLEYGTDLD